MEEKKYIKFDSVNRTPISESSLLGQLIDYKPSKEDYELAGKLGLSAAVPYASVYGFKYTPAAKALINRTKKLSTKIEKFYDKGITQKTKRTLGWEQFKAGEMGDVDKFIKKYPNEFSPDMDYKAKVDHVKGLIKKQGLYKPAELLALADLEKAEQSALNRARINPQDDIIYGHKSKERLLRHERLMTENIKMIQGLRPDEKVLLANGLSRPENTNVRKLFSGHETAIEKWKSWGDKNVTVSNVLNIGGDRDVLLSSVKRNPHFALLRDVANSTADLNNPLEVRAVAKESLSKFDWGKGAPRSLRFHPHIETSSEVNKILESFMEKYKVKGNRISINFSPQYKPHILLGGVNADVYFDRAGSRKVRIPKKISKTFVSGNLGKLRAHGSTYDILISDDYDMFPKVSKLIQKSTHFNIVHESGKSSSNYGGYKVKPTVRKKAVDYKRTKRRKKLKTSLKAKDFPSAVRHAKKISNKGLRGLVRFAKFIY